MRASLLGMCLASMTLAACSGGGGGAASTPTTVTPGGSSSGGSANSDAVAATNGVGSPVKDYAVADENVSTVGQASSTARFVASTAASATSTGTCRNGVEFFAPDTAGDVDSTEQESFYDAGCTQLARDVVRIYAPGSNATTETVSRTTSFYSPGSATAVATKTANDTIQDATFDANGFPELAKGFARSGTSTLTIAGTHVTAAGGELVMEPATSSGETFCSDSAGYSVTGSPTLQTTFGWAGGNLSGGTRVVNADGSATWTATHAGTAYQAPIGGLSLVTGTPNTACPIATPASTLAGGTATGTYSIPVVATYERGVLLSLSVTNATLANGDTLNVSTTPGAARSSVDFITGTLAKNGTTVATFSVDGFGDGTLTVASTGGQFVITDWHVVR